MIYNSYKNTIETSLTSKKCHLAKFYKVDTWGWTLLFTGEASLSGGFSFEIHEIPVQIQNRLNTSLNQTKCWKGYLRKYMIKRWVNFQGNIWSIFWKRTYFIKNILASNQKPKKLFASRNLSIEEKISVL